MSPSGAEEVAAHVVVDAVHLASRAASKYATASEPIRPLRAGDECASSTCVRDVFGREAAAGPAILGGVVRPPKILAVVSAVDLDFRYGCTPAWWQLWKGLYEAGVDLIVTPYRGRAIESPWWRTEPNPCYREGEAFDRARRARRAPAAATRTLRRDEEQPGESLADRAVREVIRRWVTPRWQRHLERILERERDVDAVVVFTVPMSHLRGIPTALRERFGVPVVFYDADVPMSLPEFGGMDTGLQHLPRRRPVRVRPRPLQLRGRAPAAARARRAPRRAPLLGRRPGAVRAAAGREGARRLLLRLRRQVPARLDGRR